MGCWIIFWLHRKPKLVWNKLSKNTKLEMKPSMEMLACRMWLWITKDDTKKSTWNIHSRNKMEIWNAWAGRAYLVSQLLRVVRQHQRKRSQGRNYCSFWLPVQNGMKFPKIGNSRIMFMYSEVYPAGILELHWIFAFRLDSSSQLAFHKNSNLNRTSWCILKCS